jgi:hypothetical protein
MAYALFLIYGRGFRMKYYITNGNKLSPLSLRHRKMCTQSDSELIECGAIPSRCSRLCPDLCLNIIVSSCILYTIRDCTSCCFVLRYIMYWFKAMDAQKTHYQNWNSINYNVWSRGTIYRQYTSIRLDQRLDETVIHQMTHRPRLLVLLLGEWHCALLCPIFKIVHFLLTVSSSILYTNPNYTSCYLDLLHTAIHGMCLNHWMRSRV